MHQKERIRERCADRENQKNIKTSKQSNKKRKNKKI